MRWIWMSMVAAACGSTGQQLPTEAPPPRPQREPAGTREDPIIFENGLRGWREGETNVQETAAPLWCLRFKTAEEECFFGRPQCMGKTNADTGSCFEEVSAACITVRHKVSGNGAVSCWGEMNLCEQTWLELTRSPEVTVGKCFVARYLGR